MNSPLFISNSTLLILSCNNTHPFKVFVILDSVNFLISIGNFYCGGNHLTSLKYCPETVGGDFWCSYNQITNFDGLPEFFEQPIYLLGNPVYEIYKLFKRDPRCIYWIREFDAIQGDEVVRDRLEEVFHTLGMDIPKDISLRNYEIINY